MQSRPDPQDLRERPIGELTARLMSDVSVLIREEIDLARVEITESLKQNGRVAGSVASLGGAALVTSLLALGTFTTLLILVLSLWMAAWVATLIVTVVYGVVATVVAMQARNKVKEFTSLKPVQTVQTVKEDVKWTESQVKSVAK